MRFAEQKRDQRVDLRVTQEEREYLQHLAHERQTTVANLVRSALDYYLASLASDASTSDAKIEGKGRRRR